MLHLCPRFSLFSHPCLLWYRNRIIYRKQTVRLFSKCINKQNERCSVSAAPLATRNIDHLSRTSHCSMAKCQLNTLMICVIYILRKFMSTLANIKCVFCWDFREGVVEWCINGASVCIIPIACKQDTKHNYSITCFRDLMISKIFFIHYHFFLRNSNRA